MREELARAHAQLAVKLAVAEPVGLRRIVWATGFANPQSKVNGGSMSSPPPWEKHRSMPFWSFFSPPEQSVCTNLNDPQTLRAPDGHEQEAAPQSHNRKDPGR